MVTEVGKEEGYLTNSPNFYNQVVEYVVVYNLGSRQNCAGPYYIVDFRQNCAQHFWL